MWNSEAMKKCKPSKSFSSTPMRPNTKVAANIKMLIISKFFVIVGIVRMSNVVLKWFFSLQNYEKYPLPR